MELSIIADEQMLEMDDSFLISKPEEMDDEVTKILKKWNLTNPSPKKIARNEGVSNQNETFDTRTFTRPKRRIFPSNSHSESDGYSVESGIGSINLQVGGAMNNSKLMQKSWLNDVSPPSSICTSMDFQNVDNMLNSLITSSDFNDISFLLNGSDADNTLKQNNATVTLENVSPTKNLTRNLMDFTFDVTRTDQLRSSETFIADSEPPMKEFGINNADITLCESTENIENKNLTYNAYTDNGNLTWNKIQEHQNMMNATIVQSTPVHADINVGGMKKDFDHTMSPISRSQLATESDEEADVVIRNLKARRLVNDISFDDYRNSMEDQCEFLLNEETIKLSSKVCGDSFDNLEMKSEKDFDKMLDSFNVKKSLESEKLLQSVDTIKLRHSLINFEKQREEKLKKDDEGDNRNQYETMTKSNERLLRRSRLYDDVNLQLQKQQTESNDANDPEEIIDKSNRDRFKTIKINKKLQSGMVIVNDEAEAPKDDSSTSPGANKERQNKLNQKTQENEDVDFKRPAPAPSRLSKFGFSRPTYRSRQDLNLPLKANSTDSLDNDEPRATNSNLKSPMGIKSKSIHNLMFNGNAAAQHANRMGSYGNLRLSSPAAKSQSNLKGSRASSLVRQVDQGFKAPLTSYNNPQSSQVRAPTSRKISLVRPSSGYYGAYTAKQLNSDNESGCSLSSSSASSRNSVAAEQLPVPEDMMTRKAVVTGTIPKASGLRLPSNLRAPQARSGLPRPTTVKR